MYRLWKSSFILLFATLVVLGIPLAIATMQDDTPSPKLDITGINPTDLPTTFTITTNVTDSLGQPVADLTTDDFVLSGALDNRASILSAENITDDNLTFAVVLVIDTSSSMAGVGERAPIAQAQAAAIEFVNNIGDGNPIAVITFNDDVQLLQDFTTDKTALLNTLNNLPFGGETDLYSAAVAGVEKAADSGNSRRVVIILSDGAQYVVRGNAEATREDALNTAIVKGVPVYTIGLGYGTDRTYLDTLATGTNAHFYESPTADQLTEIYAGLASLLRSLYVVTVGINDTVPLDGTEYEIGLQATTTEGATNVDTATLRVPIPVPLVNLEPQPDAPLTEPIEFTARITSDDALTEQGFSLSGNVSPEVLVIGESTSTQGVALETVQTVQLDPFTLAPGDYTLTYSVTDETGDTASSDVNFSVAALPAVFAISPDLATLGEISEPTTITLDLSEQTPTTGVQFSVDGAANTDVTTAPYSFEIIPAALTPGSHTLDVVVTSASGATTTTSSDFTVAALAPEVTVTGLEANSVLTEATTIEVEISGQTPGQSVAFAVNGNTLSTDTEAPYSITLEPLDFAPNQTFTLQITSTNAGGASTTTEIPFSFDLAPFLTATPPTNTPTFTFTPTFTPTPTLDFAATEAVETQVALATVDAQNTADAISTLNAEQTANAVATSDALGTAAAEAQATDFAFATNDAVSTANAVSTLDAQATTDAQATLDMQAALDTQATTDAQATLDTQAALDAQATTDAQATSNANTTADAIQQATTDAVAAENAAQQTADAQNTLDAEDTAQAETQAAEQTNTMNLTTTADQDMAATLDAQATADAAMTDAQNALATEQAQQTLDAESTVNAQATLDAEANAMTATANQISGLAQVTDASEPSATPITPTREPSATNTKAPSATIRPSNTASEIPPSATATIRPSNTASKVPPTNTPTEAPTTLEPSPEASATQTISSATNTEGPTTEAPTQITQAPTATVFDATSTPGTPTEIIAQGAPQTDNTLPLLAIGCGVLIVILMIVLYLVARRRREQQS